MRNRFKCLDMSINSCLIHVPKVLSINCYQSLCAACSLDYVTKVALDSSLVVDEVLFLCFPISATYMYMYNVAIKVRR